MSGRQPRVRVAAVVTRGDALLMVRHRKAERAYWMLPGGGLDWGETFEACAAREVKEETGFDVSIGRMLFLSEAICPQGSRHIVNVYMQGEYLGGELAIPPDDVIDQVAFVPYGNLLEVPMYPAIAPNLLRSWQEGHRHEIWHLGNLWT